MNSVIKNNRQKGLVVILMTLALTVLLGFAALAIDMNHVVLNKSRLQNGVDSAALAGAVVADAGKSTTEIANAVLDTLKTHTSISSGNGEIGVFSDATFDSSDTTLTLPLSDSATLLMQFSNDPSLFPMSDEDFDGSGDIYVRVAVSDVPLNGFFVGLFGLEKHVSASAVAGPSSSVKELCNLVPMAACAFNAADKDFGGFVEGKVMTLKSSDWHKSGMNSEGNFGLLNYGDQTLNDLDEQLAGGYEGCLVDGFANGATGNKIGVVKNGLNTRFGDPYDPDFPPDILTTSGTVTTVDGSLTSSFTYADYLSQISSENFTPESNGESGRRMLQIPILDCDSGVGSGSNYVAPVVTIGCFFLVSKAPESAGNNEPQFVYGEFVSGCRVNNASFGQTPNDSGAYKIQLYQDPNKLGI
jgi:hypothetical protein